MVTERGEERQEETQAKLKLEPSNNDIFYNRNIQKPF